MNNMVGKFNARVRSSIEKKKRDFLAGLSDNMLDDCDLVDSKSVMEANVLQMFKDFGLDVDFDKELGYFYRYCDIDDNPGRVYFELTPDAARDHLKAYYDDLMDVGSEMASDVDYSDLKEAAKIKTNSKTIDPVREIAILKEIASCDKNLKLNLNSDWCQVWLDSVGEDGVIIKISDKVDVYATNDSSSSIAYSVDITTPLDMGKILEFLSWT